MGELVLFLAIFESRILVCSFPKVYLIDIKVGADDYWLDQLTCVRQLVHKVLLLGVTFLTRMVGAEL